MSSLGNSFYRLFLSADLLHNIGKQCIQSYTFNKHPEFTLFTFRVGFPAGSGVKNPRVNAGAAGSIPGSGRSPRRKWKPTPVFLPGKSHGQRSLVGYIPWDHKSVGHNLGTKQQQHLQGEIWTYIF